MMHGVRQDLRYALRSLYRHRVFALTAILTLGLGIGANIAIFSAVNGVLLRPLPYPDPDRILTVWGHHASIGRETASLPDFLDWRKARSFSGMAAWTSATFTVTGSDEPQVVSGALVTPDYFRVLGAPVPAGRDFRDDEARGAARVVVLSQGYWERAYGGRPDVVGRRITLGGVPYTIVGAGARGLALPAEVDVWTPLQTDTTLGRRSDFLQVIGRLAPGATPETARVELTTIARRLEAEYPETNAGWGVELIGLQERIVGEIRPALLVFLGAVGLVLLIACANVANLMLVRVAARERELTIRAALGASKKRLVRQLLTESVLLALAGGLLGLGLAAWGVGALRALEPGTLPRVEEVGLDARALAFALTLSVTTGLLFGVVPAIRALGVDLRGGLAEGGRALSGTRSATRTRAGLVLAEVALASVLLVGAALLLRSFVGLTRVDPGVAVEGILTARVTLPRSRYDDPARQVAFADALLDRARALPGVSSAALGTGAPVDGGLPYWAFAMGGVEQPPPEVVQDAVIYQASPEYFHTFALPLIRGRLFDAGDRADRAPVAIVSQGLAQRYWPGRDPLGSRITFDDPTDSAAAWMTVVGVVGDVRQDGAVSPAYPQIYVPFAQDASRAIVVSLRTARNPLALAGPLKQALEGVDPSLAFSQVTTMEQRVAGTLARPRVNALLLGAFAATALLLAALGIYGVIAYSVVQRTRELGIRVALGASAEAVLGMVMRQGLTPVLIGLVVGLGAAAIGSRVLRSLLYGVSGTDLAAYAVVAAFLTAVAAAASYLPARRAARSDPVKALRAE
ncbi:MAG TPA: ABC transporter permease [Gemmatimonadales bacterium]|nr:ABC transporter permease [Gemmatimonadales bacterium]